MDLDALGMSQAEFLPWVAVVLGLTVVALIVVLRRGENDRVRVLWLLLVICVPILAPLAALLYYALWLPSRAKTNAKGR